MHLTFAIAQSEQTKARIREAAALATGDGARQAAGGGLRNAVVTHLQGLGPNKRFPEATTRFYAQAADSVTAPEVEGDVTTISITQIGMRQRLLGGFIQQNTPGKTYLTIPNEAYAYGRLAPEFLGLKFAYVRNEEGYFMPALLATDLLALSGAKKRKKGSRPPLEVGDVVYWLVRKVFQEPDPSVLPTQEEMEEAVLAALNEFIAATLHDPEVYLSS